MRLRDISMHDLPVYERLLTDPRVMAELGAPLPRSWMVLPGLQGRGLATLAVRSLLERAAAERRWDVIHAFPGVSNGPVQRHLPEVGLHAGRSP